MVNVFLWITALDIQYFFLYPNIWALEHWQNLTFNLRYLRLITKATFYASKHTIHKYLSIPPVQNVPKICLQIYPFKPPQISQSNFWSISPYILKWPKRQRETQISKTVIMIVWAEQNPTNILHEKRFYYFIILSHNKLFLTLFSVFFIILCFFLIACYRPLNMKNLNKYR